MISNSVNSVPSSLGDSLAPPETKKGVGSSELGRNEFVKLLMSQLGHQDPTKPMDSQAFVAQLAQFATLEQHNATNEKLDSILMAEASAAQTSAATFVGKDISFRSDAVKLVKDEPVHATGKLESDAEQVTVTITDNNNKTVRTLQMGKQKQGDVNIEWDGRDEQGNTLSPGDYKIKVGAADDKKKVVKVDMRAAGHVTGVMFENGYPELVLSTGSRVKMQDVIEMKQRSEP